MAETTQGSNALVPADKLAGLQRFQELAQKQGREIVGEREKIVLEIGDFTVALLTGIREGGKVVVVNGVQKDETFRIYELETKEGKYIMLGNADLDSKVTGPLVNHVLGIALVGARDVGKQSPMKVYQVVDFGSKFPDADLPF